MLSIRSEVKAIISQFFKAQAVLIYSDVQIAFPGATQGMPGAIVYAGTGSFAYGVNDLGVKVKGGGWGYIFDDLGSAYDTGRRALQSVFQRKTGVHLRQFCATKYLRILNAGI